MKCGDSNRLLTRAEVEERYGITKRFLELAASSDDGPRLVRFGRSVRYRVTDIEAWIESCAVTSGQTY